MPKKPSNKSKHQNIKVGDINISEGLSGSLIVGNNNIINQTPKQIKLSSLHQLPPAPADFTGREKLVEELLKDFESHKGATISGLTGMGGIGKTALGLVVAHQIVEKYPDAQIFLDLKGTTRTIKCNRDCAPCDSLLRADCGLACVESSKYVRSISIRITWEESFALFGQRPFRRTDRDLTPARLVCNAYNFTLDIHCPWLTNTPHGCDE